MVSYTYGDATYNAELQVRHQKLLTMFVLISDTNMFIKNLTSKKNLTFLQEGEPSTRGRRS